MLAPTSSSRESKPVGSSDTYIDIAKNVYNESIPVDDRKKVDLSVYPSNTTVSFRSFHTPVTKYMSDKGIKNFLTLTSNNINEKQFIETGIVGIIDYPFKPIEKKEDEAEISRLLGKYPEYTYFTSEDKQNNEKGYPYGKILVFLDDGSIFSPVGVIQVEKNEGVIRSVNFLKLTDKQFKTIFIGGSSSYNDYLLYFNGTFIPWIEPVDGVPILKNLNEKTLLKGALITEIDTISEGFTKHYFPLEMTTLYEKRQNLFKLVDKNGKIERKSMKDTKNIFMINIVDFFKYFSSEEAIKDNSIISKTSQMEDREKIIDIFKTTSLIKVGYGYTTASYPNPISFVGNKERKVIAETISELPEKRDVPLEEKGIYGFGFYPNCATPFIGMPIRYFIYANNSEDVNIGRMVVSKPLSFRLPFIYRPRKVHLHNTKEYRIKTESEKGEISPSEDGYIDSRYYDILNTRYKFTIKFSEEILSLGSLDSYENITKNVFDEKEEEKMKIFKEKLVEFVQNTQDDKEKTGLEFSIEFPAVKEVFHNETIVGDEQSAYIDHINDHPYIKEINIENRTKLSRNWNELNDSGKKKNIPFTYGDKPNLIEQNNLYAIMQFVSVFNKTMKSNSYEKNEDVLIDTPKYDETVKSYFLSDIYSDTEEKNYMRIYWGDDNSEDIANSKVSAAGFPFISVLYDSKKETKIEKNDGIDFTLQNNISVDIPGIPDIREKKTILLKNKIFDESEDNNVAYLTDQTIHFEINLIDIMKDIIENDYFKESIGVSPDESFASQDLMGIITPALFQIREFTRILSCICALEHDIAVVRNPDDLGVNIRGISKARTKVTVDENLSRKVFKDLSKEETEDGRMHETVKVSLEPIDKDVGVSTLPRAWYILSKNLTCSEGIQTAQMILSETFSLLSILMVDNINKNPIEEDSISALNAYHRVLRETADYMVEFGTSDYSDASFQRDSVYTPASVFLKKYIDKNRKTNEFLNIYWNTFTNPLHMLTEMKIGVDRANRTSDQLLLTDAESSYKSLIKKKPLTESTNYKLPPKLTSNTRRYILEKIKKIADDFKSKKEPTPTISTTTTTTPPTTPESTTTPPTTPESTTTPPITPESIEDIRNEINNMLTAHNTEYFDTFHKNLIDLLWNTIGSNEMNIINVSELDNWIKKIYLGTDKKTSEIWDNEYNEFIKKFINKDDKSIEFIVGQWKNRHSSITKTYTEKEEIESLGYVFHKIGFINGEIENSWNKLKSDIADNSDSVYNVFSSRLMQYFGNKLIPISKETGDQKEKYKNIIGEDVEAFFNTEFSKSSINDESKEFIRKLLRSEIDGNIPDPSENPFDIPLTWAIPIEQNKYIVDPYTITNMMLNVVIDTFIQLVYDKKKKDIRRNLFMGLKKSPILYIEEIIDVSKDVFQRNLTAMLETVMDIPFKEISLFDFYRDNLYRIDNYPKRLDMSKNLQQRLFGKVYDTNKDDITNWYTNKEFPKEFIKKYNTSFFGGLFLRTNDKREIEGIDNRGFNLYMKEINELKNNNDEIEFSSVTGYIYDFMKNRMISSYKFMMAKVIDQIANIYVEHIVKFIIENSIPALIIKPLIYGQVDAFYKFRIETYETLSNAKSLKQLETLKKQVEGKLNGVYNIESTKKFILNTINPEVNKIYKKINYGIPIEFDDKKKITSPTSTLINNDLTKEDIGHMVTLINKYYEEIENKVSNFKNILSQTIGETEFGTYIIDKDISLRWMNAINSFIYEIGSFLSSELFDGIIPKKGEIPASFNTLFSQWKKVIPSKKVFDEKLTSFTSERVDYRPNLYPDWIFGKDFSSFDVTKIGNLMDSFSQKIEDNKFEDFIEKHKNISMEFRNERIDEAKKFDGLINPILEFMEKVLEKKTRKIPSTTKERKSTTRKEKGKERVLFTPPFTPRIGIKKRKEGEKIETVRPLTMGKYPVPLYGEVTSVHVLNRQLKKGTLDNMFLDPQALSKRLSRKTKITELEGYSTLLVTFVPKNFTKEDDSKVVLAAIGDKDLEYDTNIRMNIFGTNTETVRMSVMSKILSPNGASINYDVNRLPYSRTFMKTIEEKEMFIQNLNRIPLEGKIAVRLITKEGEIREFYFPYSFYPLSHNNTSGYQEFRKFSVELPTKRYKWFPLIRLYLHVVPQNMEYCTLRSIMLTVPSDIKTMENLISILNDIYSLQEKK
jgi:hypothetical protein